MIWVSLLFLIVFSSQAFAQALQPFPAFDLLNHGYGASALGMGGAIVAIGKDPTTIYWNPGGLAQLNGLQFTLDYLVQADSDEHFASETQPNRVDSIQRYSLSGNRLGSIAVSYSLKSGRFRLVPAFAWQRSSFLSPERELKDPASLTLNLDPIFVKSDGFFRQEFRAAGEELTFGLGAAITEKIFVGASWTFLSGKPKELLRGMFKDTRTVSGDISAADLLLEQTTIEDISGNYLKLGGVIFPNGFLSFGGYLRFPYTRTSDVLAERKGTIVTNGQGGAVSEFASALSKVEVPFEWTAGVAIHPRSDITLAGSITYSNWSETFRIVSSSSNSTIIPQTALPYPTLRANGIPQYSLLQLRSGVEYVIGQTDNGIFLRAGIFRDGQPYANVSGERVIFNGYTLGVGVAQKGLTLDFAFVDEKGDVTFTSFSDGPSKLSSRRFVFTVGWFSI